MSIYISSTLICLDITDILSGVQKVWYRWDNANTNTNTSLPIETSYSITLPAEEGQHLLTIYAQDTVGNIIRIKFIFIVDNTAPVEVISGIADGVTVSGNVPIQISDSDNTGVAYTLLKLDGKIVLNTTATMINYTLKTADYQNGNHIFTVEVFDAAGNVFTHDYPIAINNTGFSFLGLDLGTLLSISLAVALPAAGLVYWKSYSFRNRKLIRDYMNDISIEDLAKKYKKTQHRVEDILRRAKKLG